MENAATAVYREYLFQAAQTEGVGSGQTTETDYGRNGNQEETAKREKGGTEILSH